MKKLAIALCGIVLLNCSEKKTETISENNSTEIVEDKNREIDSLKSAISENESAENEEAVIPPTQDEEPEIIEDSGLKDLSGKHSLTLQWISWEKPGTVNFKKIGEEKYQISGIQQKGNDYLKIAGEIEHISSEQLHFEGTIETNIKSNGGKCVRTGRQIFLQTQNRKYWRMQDMVHCFGLTDYVDIYF